LCGVGCQCMHSVPCTCQTHRASTVRSRQDAQVSDQASQSLGACWAQSLHADLTSPAPHARRAAEWRGAVARRARAVRHGHGAHAYKSAQVRRAHHLPLRRGLGRAGALPAAGQPPRVCDGRGRRAGWHQGAPLHPGRSDAPSDEAVMGREPSVYAALPHAVQ